jgi:cellulose biosynthesis protein BcsQ
LSGLHRRWLAQPGQSQSEGEGNNPPHLVAPVLAAGSVSANNANIPQNPIHCQPHTETKVGGSPKAVSPSSPNPKAAITVAVFSGKGGSGKTTTTFNLGAALVRAGKRVLYVDMDGGQASLSAWVLGLVGEEVENLEYGLYEAMKETVLQGKADSAEQRRLYLEKASRCARWLDRDKRRAILANNLELAALETELIGETGREYFLKQFLQFFKRTFDFILIDCPANRGLLTVNSLTAADYLLMPIELTPIAWQATRSMLQHPRFLPAITGRSWREEMTRLGLDSTKWHSASLKKPKAKSATTPTGQAKAETPTNQPDQQIELEWDEADEDSRTQLVYPNPALRLAGVVPFRFDPDSGPNREVLEALTQVFGPLPYFDTQTRLYQPATSRQSPGFSLLMPPVRSSATYQRGFSVHKDVAELNKRFAPLWDYVARQVIGLADEGSSAATPNSASRGDQAQPVSAQG